MSEHIEEPTTNSTNNSNDSGNEPASTDDEQSPALQVTDQEVDTSEEDAAIAEGLRKIQEESERERLEEKYGPQDEGDDIPPEDGSEVEEDDHIDDDYPVDEATSEEPPLAAVQPPPGPSADVQAAMQLGLTQGAAEALQERGELTAVVIQMMQARSPAVEPEVQPEPEPALKLERLSVEDGHTEEEVARWNAMVDANEALQKKLDSFDQAQSQKAQQEAVHAETSRQVEELFTVLKSPEWSDQFGEDPHAVPEGTEQFENLDAVYRKAKSLQLGDRVSGEPELQWSQYVTFARDGIFSRKTAQLSTQRQVAKLKENEGRMISRPTTRRSKPKAGTREEAVSDLQALMNDFNGR